MMSISQHEATVLPTTPTQRDATFRLALAIGGAIREGRKDLGLSQAQLGTKAGVGRNTVNSMECGSVGLLLNIVKISIALGRTPEGILREAIRA